MATAARIVTMELQRLQSEDLGHLSLDQVGDLVAGRLDRAGLITRSE